MLKKTEYPIFAYTKPNVYKQNSAVTMRQCTDC